MRLLHFEMCSSQVLGFMSLRSSAGIGREGRRRLMTARLRSGWAFHEAGRVIGGEPGRGRGADESSVVSVRCPQAAARRQKGRRTSRRGQR